MQRYDPKTLPQAEQVRILVVDDEALVRFPIAEALRDLNITVIEAASADEAWEYIATGAPLDLVFTDHQMPGSMTGLQLALKIRDTFPRVPVVLTSGTFDGKGWPDPVVQKPYSLAQVTERLAIMAVDADKR
jgi:CheY-like chemotaxis protein